MWVLYKNRNQGDVGWACLSARRPAHLCQSEEVLMGKPRTGPNDTPRNRIIYDLRRKGFSYSEIASEMQRRGFKITSQRVHQLVNAKREWESFDVRTLAPKVKTK